MRLTPAAESSATENDFPLMPVCDRHIHFQVPDIAAAKSLSHSHGISVRMP